MRDFEKKGPQWRDHKEIMEGRTFMPHDVNSKAFRKEVRETLEKKAGTISKADANKALKQQHKALNMVSSHSVLSGQMSNVRLFLSFLEDVITRRYTSCEWGTIALIIVGIFWLVSPLDLVPDFIPLAGLIDDVIALTLIASLTSSELNKYKIWKRRQKD